MAKTATRPDRSIGISEAAVLAYGTLAYVFLACGIALSAANSDLLQAADLAEASTNPLYLPAVGDTGLILLSPTLLEFTTITTEPQLDPSAYYLDFQTYPSLAPGVDEFAVTSGGKAVAVKTVGFRRRVVYAPLRERDLRIGNYLYLELSQPIQDGQTVEVRNPSGKIWAASLLLSARADPLRWSPAIHVNQVGYAPGFSKKAMVGYYLGSMGEMAIPNTAGFKLVVEPTGQQVFSGALVARQDTGYSFPTYQQVWEADFTAFTTPGQYRLVVPGLGASWPFLIDEGVAAAFARTYALGLYHQRCGMANELPFTRFTHGPCHIAPADIPTMAFQQTQDVLAGMSSDYASDPLHTAPQLKDVASSLYPFVNAGKVDVSGGHHDAGDYSKYTIDSAALIHYLVFAADALPGAGELDNLGIPESGDGKSDLLQEAKWEADFLAKMQDADGGFYFLVYPRDRQYEDDVLPDHGDPQVVFPKTTAVTAAAVAALAQTASSPRFQQQFPDAAKVYLSEAKLGWDFLQRAIARYGRVGAYQKISHYGDTFEHNDELAWAATELFLATGDPAYQQDLMAHYDPADANTRRWGWWRLFEGYGCAVRSYAFGVRTGRVKQEQLDGAYLAKCQAELLAGAQDQLSYAQANAYGTSFALEDKRFRNAAWYFPNDRALDLAVGYQIDPRPEFLEAILSNLNYEGGCNPVNVSYMAGLGWKREREVVDQYAQNDRRVLPPSGKPSGSIQAGFGYLNNYQDMLGLLSFPPDGDLDRPYPFYDRWGDSFNLSTEFVVVNQARSLASLAFLFAQTSVAGQAWQSAQPTVSLQSISDTPKKILATVSVPGVDLSQARVVWESKDLDPVFGQQVTIVPVNVGPQWTEVEAQLPDGRRVFGESNFFAASVPTYTTNSIYKSSPTVVTSDTVALYRFDGDFSDATGKHASLVTAGNALLDDSNLAWMTTPAGKALRVQDVGDVASVSLPTTDVYDPTRSQSIVFEAMVYVKAYKAYGISDVPLLSLSSDWNASLEMRELMWATGPMMDGGTQTLLDSQTQGQFLTPFQWHRVRMSIDPNNYIVSIDDNEAARYATGEFSNWGGSGTVALTLGNFDGWIDEVAVTDVKGPAVTNFVSMSASTQRNQGGDAEVNLQVVANLGTIFILQSSPDLQNWTSIVTNQVGSLPYTASVHHNESRRFYRALSYGLSQQ